MGILFLVVGGILGGILGDAVSGVQIGNVNIMPILSQHYEIFNVQNVEINLYIMELKFGIRFAPNLLSIGGIFLALFIFRHVR